MTIDINTLFSRNTVTSILNLGLQLADSLGLSTSSWRTGDPTRVLFRFMSEVLANFDAEREQFVKGAFLSSASGDWLKLQAEDQFGVTPDEATYSTPTVTLANGGGGYYPIEVGGLTVKSTASGATFHNTSAGVLASGPGTTLTLDLIADEAGSAGTVGVDEIDELVTTLLGVTIDSSTAAVGTDEQSEASIVQDCLDSRGALSPNGPPDAYEYVCKNSALTGVSTITRVRTVEDDTTGNVTVYVAGPSGAVDGASVTAAQEAVELWATPLCITPTVVAATEVSVNVTATIYGDDVPADFEDLITAALQAFFADLPIAGDTSEEVSRSNIITVIENTIDLRKTTLSAPALDTAYTEGEVPVLGTVTIVEG